MKIEEIIPLMREGKMFRRPKMMMTVAIRDGKLSEYTPSKINYNDGYWGERQSLTGIQIMAEDWYEVSSTNPQKDKDNDK